MEAIDKAEALIGSQRLIDIVYERLKYQCDDILISAPHDYDLGITNIKDNPLLPRGPAGGILSVAKLLATRLTAIEGFFTVPVDGPNFPADFCDRIYNETASAIAEDTERTHPSFAWWRLEDLKSVLGDCDTISSLSLHALARLCEARTVKWSEPNLFFNINTANDLSEYLTRSVSADNS